VTADAPPRGDGDGVATGVALQIASDRAIHHASGVTTAAAATAPATHNPLCRRRSLGASSLATTIASALILWIASSRDPRAGAFAARGPCSGSGSGVGAWDIRDLRMP
jgi:hypothetical protein